MRHLLQHCYTQLGLVPDLTFILLSMTHYDFHQGGLALAIAT
ncbi:hypothetical protein BMETH_524_0 [methanotrophic bacterial endosymbiont of Bathymodiolus sp.]|nr:hypothetical protein BMETH_524_0 [methanotrophic bacterial endosymbiont of Bathymodiolus sp.]